MINDGILDILLQQGDRGTFKCINCSKHFPCRYDFEQHHQKDHPSNELKYETNGKDVIKYGCNVCRSTNTEENVAIDHWRSHLQQWYQCLYCPKKVQYVKLIQTHHELCHNSKEVGFRMASARDNLNSLYQITLTFSNGLTMLWGECMNTKYGSVERLVSYINQLNEQQRQNQLKTLMASSSSSSGFVTNAPIMVPAAGKIGQRRQTHL